MTITPRLAAIAVAASVWLAGAGAFGQTAGQGSAVTEEGLLIVPPGAIAPEPAPVQYVTDEAPAVVQAGGVPAGVVTTDQLCANGLVVPSGYQCPTEGHCASPCIACRQSRFTGWSTAFDAMLMTASFAGGTITYDGDDRNVSGVRWTLQHESCDGGGFELRLSGAGSDEIFMVNTGGSTPSVDTAEIAFGQLDVDFYQRVWIGDSSLVLGVGPRVGVLRSKFGADTEAIVSGGGAGVSAALDRPFWQSEQCRLAYVGYGRAGFVSGSFESPEGVRRADGTLSVMEAGFGIEIRRLLWGGDIVGRLMLESQWWESNMMQPVVLDGITLRCGYQW